jgi:hypothetical protein
MRVSANTYFLRLPRLAPLFSCKPRSSVVTNGFLKEWQRSLDCSRDFAWSVPGHKRKSQNFLSSSASTPRADIDRRNTASVAPPRRARFIFPGARSVEKHASLTYLLRIPHGDRIEICRRVVVDRQQQSPSRARWLPAPLLPTLKRSHADTKHSSESGLTLAGPANGQDVDIPRRARRFSGQHLNSFDCLLRH